MLVKFFETGSVFYFETGSVWAKRKKLGDGFLRKQMLFWPNEGAMMLEVAKRKVKQTLFCPWRYVED
jgi:hypothetical protein